MTYIRTEEQRKVISDRMKRLWSEGVYDKCALGRGQRQRYYKHKTIKHLVLDLWG